MKCTSSWERLNLSKLCLEEISKNYENPRGLIDIFLESFLIISKSITDYVIMDYFETHFKTMGMKQKSYIMKNKLYYVTDRKNLKSIDAKIVNFLKNDHNTEYKKFEKIPLVAYFLTLRNILVHSMVPHIFENQYQGSGADQKIISRKFQRDFQSYLLLSEGGGLLLNSGYHLLLNDSGKDSFFDLSPLSNIDSQTQLQLKTRLENEDPLKLMQEYIDHLSLFIKNFES